MSNFFCCLKKDDLYALAAALFFPELQFSFLNLPMSFFEAEEEVLRLVALDFLGLLSLFLIIF